MKANETTTTNGSWKVLGISTEQTACDMCGKSELQKVVVMENVETGETKSVGTTCAGYMNSSVSKKSTSYLFKLAALVAGWQQKGFSTEEIVKGLMGRFCESFKVDGTNIVMQWGFETTIIGSA